MFTLFDDDGDDEDLTLEDADLGGDDEDDEGDLGGGGEDE